MTTPMAESNANALNIQEYGTVMSADTGAAPKNSPPRRHLMINVTNVNQASFLKASTS